LIVGEYRVLIASTTLSTRVCRRVQEKT